MNGDAWARIATLTVDEKNLILADLFYCLDDGRLIDFFDGWEKTREGHFRTAGARYSPVMAPIWFSLRAAGYDIGDTP